MKSLVVVATLTVVALAGCADEGPVEEQDDIPVAISRQQVEELESRILEEHPRAFAFPGQSAAAPVLKIINDTVAVGEAIGLEPINDDSAADFGGTIKAYDVSDLAPANQPVELRVRLKWWGDPGASADLDIYVNVPGLESAYSTGFDEESWNWNIVTKTMVLNTARIDGEPFEVGVQAQNGKVVHPDGTPFSLTIEAHFPQDVLAPRVPYALTLPEGATGFILESEPVTGDEHITTEMVIIDPTDALHRVVVHNDIGTETLFIPATRPGEYIFYVAEEHGGFLRVEADIPNPTYQTRVLERTLTDVVVAGPVITAPSTPDGYAQNGAIDIGAQHPLEIRGFVRSTTPLAGGLDVALALVSGAGTVHEVIAGDTVVEGNRAPGAFVAGDYGRVGFPTGEAWHREMMVNGEYSWNLRGDLGLGMEAGYTLVGYVR